jgi:spoIIIJ-associated protein
MSAREGDLEAPESPSELLYELLEEIAHGLDLDVELRVEEADDVLTGHLDGEDVGLLIGRHGQTIDAVQHLAQRIVFRGGPSKTRVVIDTDGYRLRRASTLQSIGDHAADRAVASGDPVELDPMPAGDRRIVHEHLRDRGDVETQSEGVEPERYLVVSPLED